MRFERDDDMFDNNHNDEFDAFECKMYLYRVVLQMNHAVESTVLEAPGRTEQDARRYLIHYFMECGCNVLEIHSHQ